MTQIHLRQGKLDEVRDELGIASRDKLAVRLGVSSAALYRIDSGRANAGTKFIGALLNLTGKPFDELFVIEDEEGAA